MKIAKSPEQAGEHARAILGMMLVTPQTGPGGQKVRRLLVEEGTSETRGWSVCKYGINPPGSTGDPSLGGRGMFVFSPGGGTTMRRKP